MQLRLAWAPDVLGVELADLGDDREAYRWHFLIRNNRERDDYSQLIRMCKAFDNSGATLEKATGTVVNLSRTLGTLSYSRLQCGEAAVLAEFTQRVQLMPEPSRDPMRDAFQEGFDKSKEETPLLSEDECQRLTASRVRSEAPVEANVTEDLAKPEAAKAVVKEVEAEVVAEDPKFRHMRIAEMTGQLAYRRKVCQDETVFNRDYNEYLESIPEEYREEVKTSYWKGFKHGKRLNKNLTQDQC